MSILAKQQLRDLRTRKVAEMNTLTTATLEAEDVRDMSPEETERFNALEASVKRIDARMEQLRDDDLEDDDEDIDDEEEVEPAPRGERSFVPRGSGVSSRRSLPFEAPAVHTKETRYSICKAIREFSRGGRLTGLEREISRDVEKRSGKIPSGFFMPMGCEPEYRGIAGIAPKAEYRTDLTSSTGAGAIFITPELPFIELLRNKLVLKDLGVTFLTGMVGKFSIPRQSGAASATWVSEETTVTPTAQSLDQVAFVDKTLGAATNVSRKFIYQTAVEADAFVKNDLAKQLAIAVDAAGINGSGSGANPTGILQNSTIQTNSASLAMGTNGGEPTWAKVVAMETLVATLNADRGKLRYLTSPSLRGNLKSTPKISSTAFPIYIWENDSLNQNDVPVGEVNGYPAFATNNVPINLTKGSASNCSALIFGNFEDLVVATWGGVDIIVNPYTNQTSGTIVISMLMEADVEVRHPESFAIISDMLMS